MSAQVSNEIIISFLFAGGGIVTLLTILNDWLMKRRQNKLEIDKVRMESISKAAPLYNKIALHHANNLAFELTRPIGQRNTEFVFFNVCNFLNLRHQIVNQIGDVQLADLTAEEIISNLGRNIIVPIRDHFGPLNLSIMSSLVDNELPFHEFHYNLGEHHGLFHNFEMWIAEANVARELGRNCRWYSELIMYELNYVYMIWYGKPPNLLRLDQDLRDHLQHNYGNYFQRLRRIESGSWL